MKDLGIVRKIDELGRVVIPKEIRKKYKMNEGDNVEIYTENGKVILTKHTTVRCLFCEQEVDIQDKYCRNCGKELK